MAAAVQKAKARVQARRLSLQERQLRGNNLALQTATDPEILMVGPAGTGKTVSILHRINTLMWQYPGARTLIVRKVRADLAESALVTFERDILGQDNPICANVQRAYRKIYHYPNGSTIAVGGMDRPGSILSTEYDIIYPVEAVQFDAQDWDTFVMRNRNYVIPFQQIIADTNPAYPAHWLKQRCDAGLTLLMNTFHKDNPAYWDEQLQDWTPRGRDYVLGKLGSLSGVYRARYLEGKWVIAEGAVYDEWNEAIHLIDPFEIPRTWRRFRSIDFGYNNPFVCQWWAVDPDDHMYLYREIYMTRRTVAQHAEQIKRLSAGEHIEFTVADHDAEDRATLAENGISTTPAKKEITVGIQAMQERLKIRPGDQKPRLMVFKNALVEVDTALFDTETGKALKPISTATEFPAYVWPKGSDGKPIKEVPVDLNNHGMDAARYAVRAVDNPNTITIGEAPDVIAEFFGG